MADVSNVRPEEIKEIYDGLEALSCKLITATEGAREGRKLTFHCSTNHDSYPVLGFSGSCHLPGVGSLALKSVM